MGVQITSSISRSSSLRRWIIPVFILLFQCRPLSAQTPQDSSYYYDDQYYDDQYYYDDTTGYYQDDYWYDDGTQGQYYEGDSAYYDPYYDDQYYEGDSAYYYDDQYYYPEDQGYYEDPYYQEEQGTESGTQPYYEEGVEYSADEQEGPQKTLREGVSGEELADMARGMGYTVSFTGASPGFVNKSLITYNSAVDYRVSAEFPMLLKIGRVPFRLGIEIGRFGFENYLPVGGTYKGSSIIGFLSFPAGPGQVRLGAGTIGGATGIVAENSYGFSMGNVLELRVGIRSTTAMNVEDSKGNTIGTASWMDGLLTFSFNL